MALEAKKIFRQLQDAGYDAYSAASRTVTYDVARRRISMHGGGMSVQNKVLGERQRGFTLSESPEGVLVRYAGRREDEYAFLAGYGRALENFGHAVEVVEDPDREQRKALFVTEGGV